MGPAGKSIQEKTPRDSTIRRKFNTCRFANDKEKVVDLIARVTRVSVETVAITGATKAVKRQAPYRVLCSIPWNER